MIHFNWHHFGALSAENVYRILALRSAVFVTEQNCAYTDPDGRDLAALHLLAVKEHDLIACLRLFPPEHADAPIVFGRVVTAKAHRNQGVGRGLIRELLAYCSSHFPGRRIECSAQTYLRKFYESFGFEAFGDIYNEDTIPHIAMQRDAS